MTADDKIALMKYIFDEFTSSGGVTRLMERLDDDVVYRVTVDPGTPLSGEFRGKDGVARYFAGMPAAVDHLELRVDDYFASDARSVVLGYERLRVRATGEELSSEFVVVCSFNGDAIREIVVIENLATLSRAYPPGAAA